MMAGHFSLGEEWKVGNLILSLDWCCALCNQIVMETKGWEFTGVPRMAMVGISYKCYVMFVSILRLRHF